MRVGLNWLAMQFPPRHVTERIFPWIMILLTIIGGGWIVFEHNASNKVTRISKILDLHHEFTRHKIGKKSLNELQRDLVDIAGYIVDKIRCQRRLEVDSEYYKDYANLNCDNTEDIEIVLGIDTDEEYDTKLNERVYEEIHKIFSANDEYFENIDRLLAYYRVVIACIEHGGCHEYTGFEIYKDKMISFVNMACSTLNERAKDWNDTPPDTPIVKFLRKHEREEISFLCRHHGKLFDHR